MQISSDVRLRQSIYIYFHSEETYSEETYSEETYKDIETEVVPL